MGGTASKVTSTVCQLCDAQDATPFFASGRDEPQADGADLLRCRRCGLVYAARLPAVETLAQQYDASYYAEVLGSTCTEGNTTSVARYFDTLLKQIEAHRSPARLLDLGCATGDFLVAAQKRGWSVTGLEVSPYAADQARQRGLAVLTGSLETVSPALDQYEVVTLWEVIEHLPDPLGELRRIRRLLAPGGLLAVSTPNVYGLSTSLFGRRSVIFKPSEHLFYFSRQTLLQTLSAAGFRVVMARSHLVFVTNFLAALRRPGPRAGESGGAVRLSPTRKRIYGAVFGLLHGTGIGALGVACANMILNRLGLGDGLVVFAEAAE